jgi:large subunit ribosomal protein L13
MDMNKTFFLAKEAREPRWHVIDASDQVLGRLCTKVTTLLRGKHKAEFTPHTDAGDYVVVTNCEKIRLTGNKWKGKMYASFSGYRSGLKEIAARDLFAKDPRRLIMLGVRGMLPKNKLNRAILKKLKIYVGDKHPHMAQINGFGEK